MIYALTSAGGRGFLTRRGCRQSQPEHRLALLAAPRPPPEPGAPAAAGERSGSGASPARCELGCTASPGSTEPQPCRTDSAAPTHSEHHRRVRWMSLVSRTQANALGLKPRMPATAWEAAAPLDSDRGWQDVAIRKHFGGSH